MKTQLIAITTPEGLSIMEFVIDDGRSVQRELTTENVEAEILRVCKAQSPYRLIEASELPSRDYRGAWIDTGSAIGHDMAKAREIHRNKIRETRAPILAKLDVDYLAADERSDHQLKATIAAKKVALRNLPQSPEIEAATTVEQLRAFWPNILQS